MSSYMSIECATHTPYQGTHLQEEAKPMDSFHVCTAIKYLQCAKAHIQIAAFPC